MFLKLGGLVAVLVAAVANFSWTLADASSLFLYVNIDTLGNMTPDSTTVAPATQPGGTFSTAFGLSRTRNSLSFVTSGNPYGVLNKAAGTYTALTVGSWKYKFAADRGW